MPSSLASQLAFYGAYHHNPANQVVHAIFVPMIFFSALLFLAQFGVKRDINNNIKQQDNTDNTWMLNLSTPALALYVVTYVTIGGEVGVIAAIFYTLLWYLANVMTRMEKEGSLKRHTCFKVAAFTHVLSWVVQVAVGHAIFEGRKPALLDSLIQSFGLAPLFVVYETIFAMGFKQQLKNEINEEILKTHLMWAASSAASVIM
jgi:uncharacterized membrane protein YGL010W